MFKQQVIDQVSQQVGKLLQSSPLQDFENNFKAILRASFAKLDLVTREEFTTQQKVLLNTRSKIEELEQTVKNLESLLNHKT